MHNKVFIAVLSLFVAIDVGLCYLALTITPLKLKRNVFTFQYGEEISTNVSDYVTANDSILKSVTLNIKDVSTNVGIYNASVSYFDKTYPFEIHVIDTIKPKASLKKVQWHIVVGEEINAKDLVENVEDFSSTTIYFLDEESNERSESVSYIQEGSYIERIIVEDAHGNQSAALRVKIIVGKQDEKPTFEGISNLIIKAGENIELSEGVRALDSEDGDITSKINIYGTIDVNIPGDYSIIYSVEDSNGNKTIVTRDITDE